MLEKCDHTAAPVKHPLYFDKRLYENCLHSLPCTSSSERRSRERRSTRMFPPSTYTGLLLFVLHVCLTTSQTVHFVNEANLLSATLEPHILRNCKNYNESRVIALLIFDVFISCNFDAITCAVICISSALQRKLLSRTDSFHCAHRRPGANQSVSSRSSPCHIFPTKRFS